LNSKTKYSLVSYILGKSKVLVRAMPCSVALCY